MGGNGDADGALWSVLEILVLLGVLTVGISAIFLTWLDSVKRPWLCLFFELMLELGLVSLLTSNIESFVEDSAVLRRRLKVSMSLIFASAILSTACFIITSLVVLICKSANTKRRIASALSGLSWIVYLFISVATFLAYLTVSEEAELPKKVKGEELTPTLMAIPAAFSILIVVRHIFACITQHNFRWRITPYYPRLVKMLTTVCTIMLCVAPLLVAHRVSKKEATFSDAVAVFSYTIAALLHRMSLETNKALQETAMHIAYNDVHSNFTNQGVEAHMLYPSHHAGGSQQIQKDVYAGINQNKMFAQQFHNAPAPIPRVYVPQAAHFYSQRNRDNSHSEAV